MNRRTFLQSSRSLALAPVPKLLHQVTPSPIALTMQLDWQFNAQFAGLFVAEAQGLFQQRGLAVTLKAAEANMDVPATVATHAHTLGCAEQSLILEAQIKGLPVVAIATMLQSSPLALMSLAAHPLTTLPDLKGKTIGIHPDGRKALELVLAINQISPADITLVDIAYAHKHERLQSGEFDAIQCYALDEPIDFARRTGQKPALLKLSDYGFEAYSQVIFAPSALLQRSPAAVQAFLAATFTGWQQALADIPATATLIANQYATPGSPYADAVYQAQTLENLVSYLQLSRLGQISPQRWQQAAEQLATYGLIEVVPPLTDSLWLQGWLI